MQRLFMLLARISVVTVTVATLCAASLVLYTRSQGLQIFSVQTGSMSPGIMPGDAVLVRIQPVSITHLYAGEIISYRSLKDPDAIVTHRLIHVNRSRSLLTTKGDALEQPDPVFPADRVVGVVVTSIPFAGHMFNFMRRPVGLILSVYVPAAILVAGEVRRLMRHYAALRYEVFYY
jgi:signal peptidase